MWFPNIPLDRLPTIHGLVIGCDAHTGEMLLRRYHAGLSRREQLKSDSHAMPITNPWVRGSPLVSYLTNKLVLFLKLIVYEPDCY
jgi:hypothetical protein